MIANLQKHQNNKTIRISDMIHKSQLSSIRTLKSNDAVSSDIQHDLLL